MREFMQDYQEDRAQMSREKRAEERAEELCECGHRIGDHEDVDDSLIYVCWCGCEVDDDAAREEK